MSEWHPPRAEDIDSKLRRDFMDALRERTGELPKGEDPILAVLFRSFAAQVADVYDQAARVIPETLLDELTSKLRLPTRLARPAQTVVHFSASGGYELLGRGTQLVGEAGTRDMLTFALDAAVAVSPASISLAAVYQDGQLRLHHGTERAREFEDARPSRDAVPAQLGHSPAIFIAFDAEGPDHLSRHGLFFDVRPEAADLLSHLRREVWSLLDDEGGGSAEGLLRSRAGNAGVRMLEWLIDAPPVAAPPDDVGVLLPEGFYGDRVFILPEMPPGRRFRTKPPAGLEAALRQLFQRPVAELLARPRVWLRVSLPQDASPVAEDLSKIVLHCATASNVEVFDQTLDLDGGGSSIPVVNTGGRPRRLVRPISIRGALGTEYLDSSEPTASAQTGHYTLRAGCLEIEPARTRRGLKDRKVNVRLLLTDGTAGDRVAVGAVNRFLRKGDYPDVAVSNLMKAAGGTDGRGIVERVEESGDERRRRDTVEAETRDDAQRRFAELLLTRDRVVTRADLEAVVTAFEPKARRVECRPTLAPGPGGLRRVHLVKVTLDQRSLTSPEVEAPILKRELTARLRATALLGLDIEVEVELI